MILPRREFLQLSAASAAAFIAGTSLGADPAPGRRIKAVAFDGLAVFDPRPVGNLAVELFPEKGAELANLWRIRQFEYTWLRNSLQSYADFWQVTEEALVFAANSLKLELPAARRSRLMQAFLEIKAWPDAPRALAELRGAGLRLALLSNFTAQMLDRSVENSGLAGVFEPHLSTDLARVYKPDPRAYRLAVDELGLERDQIAFVAFAGWDVAGAKSFGYPTFWANRLKTPAEELGVQADAAGVDLSSLPAFIHQRKELA